jgi:uncharacterized phage protein (TIGR02218 family)
MISTTYEGTDVFLCTHQPNWEKENVSASFEVLARSVASKTNREEREALAQELRASLKYDALFVDASESIALRGVLDSWDNRPVLCPFWPAVTLHTGGNPASVTGALKIWFEPEFTLWELGEGSEPEGFTPSADCLVAPVLWGRFEKFPKVTPITGADQHTVEFEFVEKGPAAFALTPNPVSLTTSVVNTLTVPTLTVPFAWGANSATADVRIKRSTVGFGRGDADDYRPQLPRSRQTINFALLTTDETRYLLTLFKDRLGSVKPWRCPAVHDESVLQLGRFYGDALRLTWGSWALGGERVYGSVDFITLPTEAIALTGETPGEDIGGTPSRWFGYVITDGSTTWRFTSHESDIDAGELGVFAAQQLSHGTITEAINLEINDCTLTVQPWPGSPFTRLRNQLTAAPLTVAIYEGLLSDPESAQMLFTGTAGSPRGEMGQPWEITLSGPKALLETKGPRGLLQRNCSAVFGDSRCGVNLASVSVTHSLLSIEAGVALFTTGSANALADHRFAAGEARRTIGDVVQRYLIVDSYDVDGDLACVLAGVVSPPPTGTESGWVLVPGCPGTKEACQGFGNWVNFRGAWFRPDKDPSMEVAEQTTGGGKK